MTDARPVHAGLLYCLVVFAAGFVLGVVRVLLVAPLSGELAAVALEAPVMLAIAWWACAWVAERLDVSEQFVDRLVMGGVALATLMAAEAGVAVLAQGRTAPAYFDRHGHAALLLGLLAQLAFALFPILQRRR